MRRVLMWTVPAAGVLLVVRKLTGTGSVPMGQRIAEKCERMMAGMPESFPPNRMLADLKAIREDTGRILEMLEGRTERSQDPAMAGADRSVRPPNGPFSRPLSIDEPDKEMSS